jgi:UDP-glucose 6-dehydrogenase
MQVEFRNAIQVLREHEAKPRLTTGALELDSLLAGGVELGTFNIFYGDCEPFVDRILYNLLCNCQLPKERYGFDAKTVMLNCGNYRQEQALLDLELVTNLLKAAEMAKLAELAYRFTNIGLADEVGIMCEKLGVSYVEVMRAASTSPYCHLLNPSIGVGGASFPLATRIVLNEMSSLGITSKVVSGASEVVEQMPAHFFGMVLDGLKEAGKTVESSRILIMGLAHRPNVADFMMSSCVNLVSMLKRAGALV